jgi:hypothetical protein
MKMSQLDRAIAALKADRAVLDLAIEKMEAQLADKPAKASKRTRKVPDAPAQQQLQ